MLRMNGTFTFTFTTVVILQSIKLKHKTGRILRAKILKACSKALPLTKQVERLTFCNIFLLKLKKVNFKIHKILIVECERS